MLPSLSNRVQLMTFHQAHIIRNKVPDLTIAPSLNKWWFKTMKQFTSINHKVLICKIKTSVCYVQSVAYPAMTSQNSQIKQ